MSDRQWDPVAVLRWLIREQPALLISLFYLFASGIGMYFSWRYLRHFGIDFFDYAQVSDFLLASLKEPITWMLVAGLVVAMLLDNWMSRNWGRKPRGWLTRWYGTPRYRRLNYLAFLGLVALYITIFADLKARDTLRGDYLIVTLRLAESGAVEQRALLGTTSSYVFTFDPDASAAKVYPVEALEALELPAIEQE